MFNKLSQKRSLLLIYIKIWVQWNAFKNTSVLLAAGCLLFGAISALVPTPYLPAHLSLLRSQLPPLHTLCLTPPPEGHAHQGFFTSCQAKVLGFQDTGAGTGPTHLQGTLISAISITYNLSPQPPQTHQTGGNLQVIYLIRDLCLKQRILSTLKKKR